MAGEQQQSHSSGDVVNGRYKIVQSIGKGAMGEVFIANDTAKNGREIAIKYLKWLPGKPTALEQFKGEFNLLTHLSHPHIAKVYDLEQDKAGNQFFFTSELVKGIDFLNAIAGLSVDAVEDLFVKTLRALEYLHANGVFHFDIKSANLLVGETVKLIDFGLATIRFQGRLAGTPSYMAPEMVRKENPDGRADLYSLGVLFYSALTGGNPFRTPEMEETLKNQLNLVPPPPSSINEKIPAYLDRVVMRLLEKRAEDRYQTAAQVIKDLNLRSSKNYTVETEETQASYIPWESKFIGRKKEMEPVLRLLSEKKSSIVVVTGKNGTGKSRFLTEIKYQAQVAEWTTRFFIDMSKLEEWEKSIAELARRPLIAGIDDYHLIAEELWGSRIEDACRSLINRMENNPVILIVSADEGAKLPEIFTETLDSDVRRNDENVSSKNVLKINLSNFTQEEIREYLTAVTGLPSPKKELVEQIHTNTGGNAFLVTELVKALVTGGKIVDTQGRWKESTFEDIAIDMGRIRLPASVEDRIAGDFEGIPGDAMQIAEALAVYGAPLNPIQVSEITSNRNTMGALMALMRRKLVIFNVAEGTYFFSRPISARIIYKKMSEKDRTHWHDAIALFLKKTGGQREDFLYHASRGSSKSTAKESLKELIDIQFNAHNNHKAAENAVLYYKKHKDPQILTTLGRLYNRLGKPARAIKTIDPLVKSKSAELAMSALEIVGNAHLNLKDFAEARSCYTAALQLAEEGKTAQKIRIENFLAEVLYFEGNLNGAIEIYERTLKDAQGLPKEEQLLIRNNELGHAYFQKGEHKKAILRLEKDVELFEQVGDMRQWARCIYVLAEAYRTEGRIEDAVMALTRLIEYAKERDDLELLFRAYNGIGNIYNDQNDFENAAKFYERAVDVSSRMGGEDQMIACVANLGIVYSNAGDMKKAEEQLTSALGFLEGRKTLSGILEQYHCRVHLELGEIFRIGKKFDLAMAQLSEAEACAQTPAAAELLFWVKLTKAKTAVDMGDQTASKAYLLEAEKLADTDEKKKRLQSQK